MAITSVNDTSTQKRYGNSKIQYGITYVLITLVVLLFLNIYCSETTKQIFYQNKKSSMLEKCRLASQELSELEVINNENIQLVLGKNESFLTSRLIVTDTSAQPLYDSAVKSVDYAMLPEIVLALKGNDVFSWDYSDGVMRSRVAAPVMTYGKMTGCVYMMEYDPVQGALLESLQRNVMTITIILEIIVIVFSVLTALIYSGKLRTILSSMRIIREGNYSHKVVLRGRDELNLLADEFNLLTNRLQISENKRRQFVSDASHELKTPLASIKLLSDSILQNDMDMSTIREFVGDIGNEAERLNRLSEKLLSLSRIETQEDGDCEIIYMEPTINKVVKMLSGIAVSNHIDIQQDIRQDCPILILEDDLYQITFNLVENGIKYNTANGKLTIRLLRNGENAILSVEDTGVGIPEDALTHIFERFYRVDKARSRKSGGSGLGLSIVKNLVERNGGTIHVESTVGCGTIFTVVFPIFDTEESQ